MHLEMHEPCIYAYPKFLNKFSNSMDKYLMGNNGAVVLCCPFLFVCSCVLRVSVGCVLCMRHSPSGARPEPIIMSGNAMCDPTIQVKGLSLACLLFLS